MKLSRKHGLTVIGHLLWCGVLTLSFNIFAAERVDLPKSMGALGDSMSAGALADFQRKNFKMPWTELRLLVKLVRFGATKDVRKMEARDLSWAGGYDEKQRVYSHSYRLSKMAGLDSQMPTANVAVSGDESKDIWDQTGRLNDWAESNLNQAYPDYVTLMIGPNDICAETASDMVKTRDYHANIAKSVDEILAQSPNTRILLNSVPNIERLREVAHDKKLHVGLTCEKMWKTLKLCPTLTTVDDPGEREKVGQQVIDYNNVLRDIAETRAQSHGDRIRVSRAAYGVDFTENDLSIDCFHPNEFGQEKLAQVSFEDSWWGERWAPIKIKLKEDAAKNAAIAKNKRCKRRVRGRGGRSRKKPGC